MKTTTFEKVILTNFIFLCDKYNFKITISQNSYIRYESDILFINFIYDDKRSYEIGIEIGQLKNETIGYNLFEILQYFQHSESNRYSLIQTSDIDTLSQIIFKISKIIDECIVKILADFKNIFVELLKQRTINSAEYTLNINLSVAREKANIAWKEKKYQCFIDLLTPYKKALSKSEILKLNYAEKKI